MAHTPITMRIALTLLAALYASAGCSGEDDGADGARSESGSDCTGSDARNVPNQGAVTHEDDGAEIAYASTPPASGSHYRAWTDWGESSDALDPRSWVHNLEHGGIALLHNCPQGCPEIVEAARAYALGRPADDGGPFRYVLTPYSAMERALAIVAWEWIYEADCWNEAEVEAFVAEHYRKAPEDVAAPPR